MKRIAGVFLGLLSGRFIAALLQAATLAVIARGLAPGDFATVASVTGVLIFLSSAGDLGVTTATTREAASGSLQSLTDLIVLNRLLAVTLATTGVLGMMLLAFFGQTEFYWQLLPMGAWIGMERLAENASAIHIGHRSSKPVLSSLLLRKAGPLLAVLVASLTWPRFIILALSIGYLGGTIMAFALTRHVSHADSEHGGIWTRSRRAAKIAVPFWANSLAAQSRQLDVFIVGLFAGTQVALVYAPVARLIAPLRMIPTTFAQAILPFVVDAGQAVRIRKTLLLVFFFGVICFGSVGLMSRNAIDLLYGPEYQQSSKALGVLAVGLIAAGLGSVLTSFAQGLGKEKQVAWVSMAMAVLTLSGVAWGSIEWGATGAAGAIGVVFVLQALALAALLMRHLQRDRDREGSDENEKVSA